MDTDGGIPRVASAPPSSGTRSTFGSLFKKKSTDDGAASQGTESPPAQSDTSTRAKKKADKKSKKHSEGSTAKLDMALEARILRIEQKMKASEESDDEMAKRVGKIQQSLDSITMPQNAGTDDPKARSQVCVVSKVCDDQKQRLQTVSERLQALETAIETLNAGCAPAIEALKKDVDGAQGDLQLLTNGFMDLANLTNIHLEYLRMLTNRIANVEESVGLQVSFKSPTIASPASTPRV